MKNKAMEILEKVKENSEMIIVNINGEISLDIISETTYEKIEHFGNGISFPNVVISNLDDFESENNIDAETMEKIISEIVYLYSENY